MIELIHCHIPKTGGVSFLNMINKVYGEATIAFPWTWIRMAPEQGVGWKLLHENYPKLKDIWRENIPKVVANNPRIKVLQGHFPVGLFDGMFPDAKRIAWVRHPVARVISHWKHDMKKKHQRSMPLHQYIELPHNRDVMAFHVGYNIDNMDWIGVLENINIDIVELAEFLGWPFIPKVPHLNKSDEKPEIGQIANRITQLNQLDLALYAEVLERKSYA